MEKGRNRMPEKAGYDKFGNPDSFTLIRDLIKNWWVILLAGATAFFIVCALAHIGFGSAYRAESTLIVTGSARTGGFQAYSDNAKKFAGILTDEYILREVAEDMGMDKLNAEVKAEIISETNLICLSVRAENPSMAYRVLTGIQKHYSDISELMMPGYILEELAPVEYPSSLDNIYDFKKLKMIGALAAMAAAAACILFLSYSYDSVKNEKDVEKKLDTRLVISIYHEKKSKTFRMFLNRKNRKKALLISSPLASFGFVESFNRLREKIAARCLHSGKKIILVTSLLENEGKSTVAANLALALTGISHKVALLDADLRRPAQYKFFEKRDFKGFLGAYLKGEASVDDTIKKDSESGIYLIFDKKSNMDSSEMIGSSGMELLIRTLQEQMDYVIIDSPPMSMVADAEILARYADYSLLVLSPDHAPAKAVNDCIDRLNDCHAKLLGCVLNNVYTVGLFIRQMVGIRLSETIAGAYGKYGAYGSNYGYAVGYGYGYRTDSNSRSGSGRIQKDGEGKSRKAFSGEAFFAERIKKAEKARKEPELEGEE